MAKNALDWIALILLIIGGLNWGLAIFNYNIVTALGATITNIVYGLIGLAALYTIYFLFKE